MMQVKKELAEMHDAEVQLISLVETGANAAPFKRMKSEEPEGGADVFRAEKLSGRSVDGPQLIALAVSPKGDVEAAKAIAKAAGVEIQDTREVEGDDGTSTLLLALKQDRVNTGDPNQIQVYLDEELTAVCRVEKAFMPFNGSTSFAEAIKAQGFFPQLHNALDVFHDVAFHILDSADSPGGAAAKIQKSGDELVKLLTLMTKALPKETFKMAEVIKTLKAEAGEGTETLASTEEAEAKEKADADAKAKADKATAAAAAEGEGTDLDAKVTVAKEKADAAAEELAAAELAAKAVHVDDEEEEEDGKKKAKKPKKKADETETDPTLGKILDAIESLTTVAKQHGEAQDELKKELEAVAEKADEAKETATAAEKAANETDEAVTGRVITDAAPDGRGREERVSKGAPPLMDTGMSRYRARGGAN